jgi:hypothetical protein
MSFFLEIYQDIGIKILKRKIKRMVIGRMEKRLKKFL